MTRESCRISIECCAFTGWQTGKSAVGKRLILTGGVLDTACGKSADEQVRADAANRLPGAGEWRKSSECGKNGGPGMGDALAEMIMAMDGAVGQAARSVEAADEQVDFAEFKVLLREGIGGMTQAFAEKEEGGGFGMGIACREALLRRRRQPTGGLPFSAPCSGMRRRRRESVPTSTRKPMPVTIGSARQRAPLPGQVRVACQVLRTRTLWAIEPFTGHSHMQLTGLGSSGSRAAKASTSPIRIIERVNHGN